MYLFTVLISCAFMVPELFAAPVWRELRSLTTAGTRDGHGMVWHQNAQRVIIYGDHSCGSVNTCAESSETWEYNYMLNTWFNLRPVSNPGPLAHFPMVYDSASNRIILLRRDNGATWEYNYSLNRWINRNPPVVPFVDGRTVLQMAYNSQRARTVFFSPSTGQTWAYTYASNAWVNMNPPTPRPGGQSTGITNMIYDSRRDRIVMITNVDRRMWFYDYVTNRWSAGGIAPARTTSGGAVYYMAYDSLSDKVLWYGDDQVSWVYDPAANIWTRWNLVPTPSYHHANMVYVPNVDRIILYGGRVGNMNRTWEFDWR